LADGYALQIDSLLFQYAGAGGMGFVLRVPSLKVSAGEQVVLTGKSGSGKSTLLQLIAGLMEPERGRVIVSGQDIHALHGARRDRFRGRSIGMIFQTFNLLTGFSALENVMAAMMFSSIPAHDHKSRAGQLLASLGIDRPNQLAERLSVGQQQRVAVARAVACEPVLVLADEPTASLDPESAAASMDLIQRVCRERGAALVCVSHDPAMPARFARAERLDALALQGAPA
jgi:putative ABC transport system ATP-binding protein